MNPLLYQLSYASEFSQALLISRLTFSCKSDRMAENPARARIVLYKAHSAGFRIRGTFEAVSRRFSLSSAKRGKHHSLCELISSVCRYRGECVRTILGETRAMEPGYLTLRMRYGIDLIGPSRGTRLTCDETNRNNPDYRVGPAAHADLVHGGCDPPRL